MIQSPPPNECNGTLIDDYRDKAGSAAAKFIAVDNLTDKEEERLP